MFSERVKDYHNRMFPNQTSALAKSDPELIEIFDNFVFDDVFGHGNLDDRTRFIAILASMIGCQGIDEFKSFVPAAMNVGIKAVEIKEIVYQAVAYCGIARVLPFLKAVNEIFLKRKIDLPLEKQGTVTKDTRLVLGNQTQVDIFGFNMKDFDKSGPEETRHINRWLAENCFGDYYTRKGLNLREREMITFCFLMAQGGCEPQLIGHSKANMSLGNDRIFLIEIVSQCLPYIGYPRSLNAINCINTAFKDVEKDK